MHRSGLARNVIGAAERTQQVSFFVQTYSYAAATTVSRDKPRHTLSVAQRSPPVHVYLVSRPLSSLCCCENVLLRSSNLAHGLRGARARKGSLRCRSALVLPVAGPHQHHDPPGSPSVSIHLYPGRVPILPLISPDINQLLSTKSTRYISSTAQTDHIQVIYIHTIYISSRSRCFEKYLFPILYDLVLVAGRAPVICKT